MILKNCELYTIIPREKIQHVFETSLTASIECSPSFLGFEKVYKAVTLFVPQNMIILDLGCGYAFQSWYFRDYKKYIGVDCGVGFGDVLETDNSDFHFVSIQHFIQNELPLMDYDSHEIFAICSYVPDEHARQMVREVFPFCLIYYPYRRI